MSFWLKGNKPAPTKHNLDSGKPKIEQVLPRAAISGGEITIRGQALTVNGTERPVVRFGDQPGSVVVSSANRLVVRVPEDVVSGDLTVDNGKAVSASAPIAVGITLAENVHPVANPAVDPAGNIFTTFSGPRGQKAPVSVFKIDRNHILRPFLSDLMNPTGLAFDRDGMLYVSSRHEGTVYRITPDGQRSIYAEGMGVATGLAFDQEENLYVGDRTGTVFKIGRDHQIYVFATLEPSVSAYHLAFGPGGQLYVAGPTTSSFDHIYCVSPAGEVSSFYRGLGRPQGLAFDTSGNLYVAASFEGRRGVARVTPQRTAELFISGPGVVGLAFRRDGSLVLATNSALSLLNVGLSGKPLL